MIKFFRNIRHSLLLERKTGKYFKYAIGEIILVVIGILIAVQINNWNQNRSNNKEEAKILERLLAETEYNSKALHINIATHDTIIQRLQNLSSILKPNFKEEDLKNPQRLGLQIRSLANGARFGPKKSVISTIISTGKLDLIKNDSIRYSVSDIQSAEITYKLVNDNGNKSLHNSVIPYLTKHLIWKEGSNFHKNPSYVLSDPIFENLVMGRIIIQRDMIRDAKVLKKQYELCIRLIKNELKNK